MKKFDNHVTKLQREMLDITNNLNKFRSKNHKTISLIINNLNVLSNEIDDNNIECDSNISFKNSKIGNSKNSIDIYNHKNKFNHCSLQKYNNEINKRNKTNTLFKEKNDDKYMTFLINNKNNPVNKINVNKTQTPKKKAFRMNNIKFNQNNTFFNDAIKVNENYQTFNTFNDKNKKMLRNNSLSIKQLHKKEIRNMNNITLKNENKYLRNEMVNKQKKKSNTVTNLIFNNKKDFIYFNRNKQNYLKQNNSNKIQNCYFTQRNKDIKNQKNTRKINTFREKIFFTKMNNNGLENSKNNSFNDSNCNLHNIFEEEEENSKKYENKDKCFELNELMKLLKLNNTNDLKKRLNELYTTKMFTDKVISLFHKSNKNKEKEEINLDDILFWISSISNYKKENEVYKKYCEQLMKKNNINNFEEMKLFIDKMLNKNIQNNHFIGGVKKILSTNIDDNSDFNFIDNINI